MLIEMLNEMLIKMLIEMLIEMLFNDLMKFVRTAFDAENASDALTNFRFCQKTAPDAETVRCTDGFSMMSGRLHPYDRMHWRVFDIVKNAAPDAETIRCTDGFSMMPGRLHSDDRMHWRVFGVAKNAAPNAETIGSTGGFPIFVRGLHPTLIRQMHWRVDYDLAVSTTGVVARF